MGRLLLDQSTSSSSSSMKSSFLIQMIRWIRGSSSIEFFIFLIAWGIFFEWWELDLQFLPSSSSLLMSRASSSSQSQLKVITSFWHTFLAWMNSMILQGHSRWLSPFLHSSLFFYLFNLFLKVIFRCMFFPSNRLVKESNIYFGVFREDTCGISWSVIESTMIFLALIKFFLCKALRLISL